MDANRVRRSWQWREDAVDPEHDHFELRYGSAENSGWDAWLAVALVGRPTRNVFPVEFLIDRSGRPKAHVIRDVTRELDFYLVEKGEADPWAYAQYHCRTSANVYSTVHWSFFPAMRKNVQKKGPRKMRHAIGYHGPFQENFPFLQVGVQSYRGRDGRERPLPKWPAGVDGVRFGFMQKGRQFVAVRASRGQVDVVLKNPVSLRRARHTDGKGVGPTPTTFGDEAALRLLDAMVTLNPSQRAPLEALERQISAG